MLAYSLPEGKIDDLGVPLFQETTICLMVKLFSLTPPFGYFVNTKIKPDFFPLAFPSFPMMWLGNSELYPYQHPIKSQCVVIKPQFS